MARGPLDEIVGKYYAADITLALEYLHLKNICHRDLKPENLMINHENGHLVLGIIIFNLGKFMIYSLVDFGMAKIVEEKTWTFCGTPEYIAPEIILNNGHDIAVDYWSLGVVIYEMLSCSTPFRDSTAKVLSVNFLFSMRISGNSRQNRIRNRPGTFRFPMF